MAGRYRTKSKGDCAVPCSLQIGIFFPKPGITRPTRNVGLALYLRKYITTKDTKEYKGCLPFPLCSFVTLRGEKMTLKDSFQKWQETILKKSLDKFKERKARFETSSGIELPRLALPNSGSPAV